MDQSLGGGLQPAGTGDEVTLSFLIGFSGLVSSPSFCDLFVHIFVEEGSGHQWERIWLALSSLKVQSVGKKHRGRHMFL